MTHHDLLEDDARAAGISTLVELLEHRAVRQPDEVVFRFVSGDGTEDGTLTFAELGRRARAIAASLAEVAAPGDRVVLLVPPGLDYVAAYFGCLYSGAVAVPAYPPNPRRADPRVSGIVADSGARVALVSAGLASRLQGWLALNDGLSGVTWLDVSALTSAAESWRAPQLHRGSLAMLQYTSGSTGEPRGVMLSHANLLENSAVIHRVSAHRAGDSGVFWLPPFHDMGLIGGIVQPVYTGRPVVLMAPATFLQRPLRWLEAISRYRATTSGAPNFAYDLCVERTTDAERAALDLSSWRTSFNGAEPVRADTIARFTEAFAVSGVRPSVIVPCYGLAESTLLVTGGPEGREARSIAASRRALEAGELCAAPPGDLATTLVASGEPVRELEVAVVDPDSLARCAEGVVGEIWVAGPSVAQGYWNRPIESAATFDATLPGSASTFLRTGDLGALVDGELVVTGRIKDLVILDGRNFYPHDIELAAERSHPDLRPGFSAAFCIAGARGERLALALEVSRHHESDDAAALFQAVRAELAATVGVVPDEIVLVRQNAIPRTSSGKIQRGATRTAMLDGTLDVVGRWTPSRDDAAGRDERSLRAFVLRWLHDELQIDESRLGDDTPLVELAIDSLVATRLLVALEGHLGMRIDATRLWAQPTVRDLARHLISLARGEPSARANGVARRGAGATPDHETDVAEWPEYRALRDRLALLEAEGIESPFFQVHEGVTGSHALIDGRRVLNFANYNYLGLSGDADVTRVAQDAIARWGTSVSASRVVSGERPVHAALEQEIARFVGAEDALVYIGGHPANVSTISHLFGPEDVILCDVLMHNSAMQGAEFSGARRVTFPHNDWSALDAMLARVRSEHRRALVVIEGVYSADGDIPDLARFVAVARRHGAMLMVDEAHSLGVLGRTGRGIAEHAGVHPSSVDIWMGTLSKSLASCGGYIAGSRALIEYLKYTSPGFVYSVGITPSNAAAALAALRKLIDEPDRVETLRARSAYFLARCQDEGFDTGASSGTPIIPVIVGDSLRAARLSAMMLEAGVNVQPMVTPAVPNERARLRFFVTATHTERELETTVRLLAQTMRRLDPAESEEESGGAESPTRSTVSA
ncbi:MAG TPA: aminotransferase class I/II-fold pyridoxal phosphate-dependent enzyme [Gemmatimonadaceae bacterium]|nr:aminotransferase class I/II-fold pyridoxal phosphate-dependent enzyme [Gemmatimonadaceae bacterium]